MTRIVGVVASLHRDGLCEKLVSSALRGANAAGGETSLIHLSDYTVPQWSDQNVGKPEELSTAFYGMDGIAICSPVYYRDVNGLAKDFMDTVDLHDVSGKPGLGIAVAGGTGKGLTSALKSIYYWFSCKSIRGIDPLPVSRFNFGAAIRQAETSGQRLVEVATSGPKPFRSLAERVSYHQSLPYMGYEHVDEIALLVRQLFNAPHKKGAKAEKRARKLYERGMTLIKERRKQQAVDAIVEAYEILYF